MSDKEQPLSDLIGAPLVLFMAPEAIAGLALQKKQLDPWALQVWVQQPNALDEALLTALRCLSPHFLWYPQNLKGAAQLLLFMVPVTIAVLTLHQKPLDQWASQSWVQLPNA